MGVGKPRLDKYEKILSRLFENLALFHILKGIDGPHMVTAHAPTDVQGIRRRFLKNLCFICDYRKGGDTTTSIALESQTNEVILWVAANCTPHDKVILFLNDVLQQLQRDPKGTEEERERLREKLTKKCVGFAAPRLKKECKLLLRAASYCEKYLKEDGTTVQGAERRSLLEWLPRFSATNTDTLALCKTAYDSRHDLQMSSLGSLSRELGVAPRETAMNIKAVRHLIGRLAERIRIPALLIEDFLMLGPLFNSYQIKKVHTPIPAIVPPADGLRNLNSILKRILQPRDPRLEDMQNYLARLDGPLKLEEAIRSMYDEDKGQARVHSEIQVLEEFHRNERSFVGNDRYIACSKLSCLCCKFYFKYHPGRLEEPESHQKAYLNWRPIELPGGRENEHWAHQRRVLGMLSSELSTAVEKQIETRQRPTPWQPDSVTNITEAMNSASLGEVEADEVLGNGDGWSDGTDSASLAHMNEDEFSDESEDSDDESDGGAGLDA
ncbi:hypothetical protein Focb16_v006779 [Fusarium oxysporum f. sp. cubense]|uniref:Uncharacterized protein n=1 Tax=Fusarium oxysporum f. sp. cubense TaxID=61366 RepID=A0A559LQ44_FUSOC|nr:hypothetical protein Focb16_v006779 [Fusarium oxysporum f. sp. cubense]